MCKIVNFANQGCRQERIAQMLVIHQSTASRIVKRYSTTHREVHTVILFTANNVRMGRNGLTANNVNSAQRKKMIFITSLRNGVFTVPHLKNKLLI